MFPDEAILIRTTLTNDCAGAKIDATMTVNDVTMIVGRARVEKDSLVVRINFCLSRL